MFERIEKYVLMALALLVVVFVIYLMYSTYSIEEKISAKKCFDCDLMYDPIGMNKVMKTNCVEIPCLKEGK
jgi:Ca2+/Na+ antiporter